jgi:hypothetical protein
MVARNAGGSSAPVTVNVNWASSPVALPGRCAEADSLLFTELGSDHEAVHSTYSDMPGFAWNGTWAIRFTVPVTAHAGQTGFVQAAEFVGPPTFRELTLSSTACDFRAEDPTGATGPLARGYGVTPLVYFGIGASGPGNPGLQPGGTYYLNVRNRYTDGTASCPPEQGRCDALAAARLPR